MKTSADPRHSTRLLVLQKLFHDDFSETSKLDVANISIEEMVEINGIEKFNKELLDEIYNGVKANITQCDELIMKFAPQWPINQIKKVDLQILRLAIYEGFIGKITPPKVAIDEAIELGKDFGGNSSDKFINGVLGALYEETKESK